MAGWTIQKLLNWITDYFGEKQIDCPRLSAELLLSSVLSLSRIELYTNFQRPVSKEQLDRLHVLVKRAAQNEPIAYLTGKSEFYGLEINVSPACMIPRPETELLVDKAVEFLRGSSGRLVCDLCTGSGCIAIAIAKNLPKARIIATDISEKALAVAAENIEKHNLKNQIRLLCGDLFAPIIPPLDAAKFDLLVCNPPYVSKPDFEKLDKNVKDYEPRTALLAGADGLDIYRKLCKTIGNFLKPKAVLMLEVGIGQSNAVKKLLEDAGCFAEIKIEKDFNKIARIIIAKRQSIGND